MYALGANLMTVVFPAILPIAVVERGAAGWIGLGIVFALAGIATPLLARAASRQRAGSRSDDLRTQGAEA
ncbi:hypothetical protein EGN69_13330 [Pseudomonas monteilii]|nr:hypothetical protein EGN69_13330 [Pseudomonas monteilii]